MDDGNPAVVNKHDGGAAEPLPGCASFCKGHKKGQSNSNHYDFSIHREYFYSEAEMRAYSTMCNTSYFLTFPGRYPPVGMYDLKIAVEEIKDAKESSDVYPIFKEISDIFFEYACTGYEGQIRTISCICPFCRKIHSYDLSSFRSCNNTFLCNYCFGDFGPMCTFWMEYNMGIGILRIFFLIQQLFNTISLRRK